MEGARKTTAEMTGEALREIAVLVLVFAAPLDRWVERRVYTWSDLWKTIGLGATLFATGVILERIRRS